MKSVALTTPAADFTVTGSPIVNSGTLGFNWKIPPATTATPNAIVKWDSVGPIYADQMYAASYIGSSGSIGLVGNLGVGGQTNLVGSVAIGTSKAPIAELQLNSGDAHDNDIILLGDGTKGLEFPDTDLPAAIK